MTLQQVWEHLDEHVFSTMRYGKDDVNDFYYCPIDDPRNEYGYDHILVFGTVITVLDNDAIKIMDSDDPKDFQDILTNIAGAASFCLGMELAHSFEALYNDTNNGHPLFVQGFDLVQKMYAEDKDATTENES